ncbi:hypothetical protein [Sporosarcina sp. G11-34]|uniref:hypothetical protein n=1 Tax=Sporosarcina sp. G11-34 TaxID=2849605 RepID=UPI0022A93F90|nr:hypothetical protein [Sporosarcina sp. G11-34]MCZ2260615.1 hypothetical protein [Sporosarcina sp. G11-34]
MALEVDFKKTNERLLEIAINEKVEVGAFEVTDEIERAQVMLLFELVVTPYFSNNENKKSIKEFSEKAKRVFTSNYGMFSLSSAYSSLVEDFEELLKEIK